MGKPRRNESRSVEAEILYALRAAGAVSDVLNARIDYTEAEGLARYARRLQPLHPKTLVNSEGRVKPDILPTAQASFRFSTTDPPLVNFPARDGLSVAWGMIVPDPGTFWVHFDLAALHAREAVAYTRDPVDAEAFKNDWDVHTITACEMWKMPFPPIPTKECHTDPSCAEWRALWTPPWEGEKDRRRRLAKVMRYALYLGLDERAALESKEVAKLNLTREEILSFGRLYLRAKTRLVDTKKKMFAKLAAEKKARSFMGSLRRLYGDAKERGKDGWSHVLQGGEQEIMQTIILAIHDEFPEAEWVLYSHDGYTFSLPLSKYFHELQPLEWTLKLRAVVEREWLIEGVPIWCPADFEIIMADGTIHPFPASKG